VFRQTFREFEVTVQSCAVFVVVMKVYALNWHLQRAPVVLNATDPSDKGG